MNEWPDLFYVLWTNERTYVRKDAWVSEWVDAFKPHGQVKRQKTEQDREGMER